MERLSGVHFLHGLGSHAGLLPGLGAEIRLWNVLKSIYETSGTRFEMPRVVSCEIFTKVCVGRINYFKISWFLHYPLIVWSHIFTAKEGR